MGIFIVLFPLALNSIPLGYRDSVPEEQRPESKTTRIVNIKLVIHERIALGDSAQRDGRWFQNRIVHKQYKLELKSLNIQISPHYKRLLRKYVSDACISKKKLPILFLIMCIFVHKAEGASRGWKRVLTPWSCSYRLPPVDAGSSAKTLKDLGLSGGGGIICCLVMNISVVLPASFTTTLNPDAAFPSGSSGLRLRLHHFCRPRKMHTRAHIL